LGREAGRLARYIHDSCKLLTVKQVAAHLGLDWRTVRQVDRAFLEKEHSQTGYSGDEPNSRVVVNCRRARSAASSAEWPLIQTCVHGLSSPPARSPRTHLAQLPRRSPSPGIAPLPAQQHAPVLRAPHRVIPQLEYRVVFAMLLRVLQGEVEFTDDIGLM